MKKYIHITSGKGSEECCFVVAQVLKMMIEECKLHNCPYEVVKREKSEINGNLRSALFCVNDVNKSDFLKDWIGTIKWTSQSPYRSHHKRKNWFIGVVELSIHLNEKINFNDVVYQNFRCARPGGQNVNKVNSGVRAKHLPSGIFVKVMDTRSQSRNKKLAEKRLVERWSKFQLEKLKDQMEIEWSQHMILERGNPIKTFRSIDFSRKITPKRNKYDRSKEKRTWVKDQKNI